MALITRTIPSMLQGMSQQPPEMRHPTQGDNQKNAISHQTYGLGKRAGTDHIRILRGISTTRLWTHWINRDAKEKYVVTFDYDSVKVTSLSGVDIPVKYEDDQIINYLRSNNPRSDLKALTVNDSTFILNTTKVVKMGPQVSADQTNKAIIWIKQGNYGCDYSFTVGERTFLTRTPTDQVDELRTNRIAQKLLYEWNANPITGYTMTYNENDSFLFLVDDTEDAFDISVKDSLNGNGIGLAQNYVKSFGDLPPYAPADHVLKILGSPGDSDDDYWVYYDANRDVTSDGLKRGAWVESVGPGVAYRLDRETLPVRLVRMQDDVAGTLTGISYGVYFRVEWVDWEDRLVGDDTSAPQPSFVGEMIQEMTVYQNRLVFIFKDSVVFSRAGDFYNFWPKSVTRVDPDDPIDLSGVGGKLSHGGVLSLRHATSIAEKLVLIGDRGQVLVDAEGSLTPTSIRTRVALSVEAEDKCAPITTGSSVFIPYATGPYTHIREVFPSSGTALLEEMNISASVPKFMLGRPWRMAVCPSESTLVVQCSSNLSLLYIYKWLDVDRQRVQSSWGFWAMAGDVMGRILGFEIMGTTLWMLINRVDTGLVLESLELEPFNMTERAPWPIMMDRKVALGLTDMRVAGCPLMWETPTLPPYGGESESGFGAGDATDSPYDNTGSGEASTRSTLGAEFPPEVTASSTPSGTTPTIPTNSSYPGSSVPTQPAIPTNSVDPYGGLPNTGGGFGGGGTGEPPTLPLDGPPTIADPDVCNPLNDMRERGTMTYDNNLDRTTIILPYPPTERLKLVRSDTMQTVQWFVGNGDRVIWVRGDYTEVPMYAGIDYEFRFRFCPAIVSKQDQSGGVGVDRGSRLQLIRWRVAYGYSGPFSFEVDRDGELIHYEAVTPRRMGTEPANAPIPGKSSVFVLGIASECRVDVATRSVWPCWLTSAQWEGEYLPDFTSI